MSHTPPMSVEQIVRNLLTAAVANGLIRPAPDHDDPQRLTAGELTGVANLLAEYLRRERAADSPALSAE